jgi:hypothetical protein
MSIHQSNIAMLRALAGALDYEAGAEGRYADQQKPATAGTIALAANAALLTRMSRACIGAATKLEDKQAELAKSTD